MISGRNLQFDIMHSKCAFYSACSNLFSHSDGLDELLVLSLQETYSLPVLMYAAPALTLSSKQVAELGVCWNSVIRRLFNYQKWESVKGVLHGLGRLNVAQAHLIMLWKVKFYRHMYFSPNIVVWSLFHTALLHSCNNDSLLKSVFLHREVAIDMVYGLFDRYVLADFNFLKLCLYYVVLIWCVLLYISVLLSV